VFSFQIQIQIQIQIHTAGNMCVDTTTVAAPESKLSKVMLYVVKLLRVVTLTTKHTQVEAH
jgi:hypothetical protein